MTFVEAEILGYEFKILRHHLSDGVVQMTTQAGCSLLT
jgi:hypothetical protein